MGSMSFRRKVARAFFLLAVGSSLFQTSACDATTVRGAFLNSVQLFVTEIINVFFNDLESQGDTDFVTT